MNAWNRTLIAALVLVVSAAGPGCGSEETPAADAGPQLPRGTSLFIQVLDTAGKEIPTAAVTVAGNARVTDGAGRILLEDVAPGRVVARITAPGHAPASVVAEVPAGGHGGVEARLHPLGTPMPFDAAQGATLDQEAARVTIPAQMLVNDAGEPVTGMVEATVVPLDPAAASPAELPGPLDGAMREDGTEASLESVAMVEVSLWQGGAPVHLAPGARVTIELVLPEPQASQVTMGERIPAWWLDEAAGVWREDGEGVIQPSSQEPGKLAWVAEVEHFTWWNADKPWTDKSCFDVTVVDENGAPVANLMIGAEGVDYIGSSGVEITQPDGHACVDIKYGGTAAVTVGSWIAPLVAATQVTGTGPASACSGEGAACMPVTVTVSAAQVCTPGASEPCAYSGPQGTQGVGICQAGTSYCNATGMAWSGCAGEVLPQPETCATIFDDDCDGQLNAIDTDAQDCACSAGDTVPCYTGPPGTQGVGLCQGGTRTCDTITGLFGACMGEVLPQPEVCTTGEDEDCNGSPACAGVSLWSRAFGGGVVQQVTAIATDAAGNVLMAGALAGPVDFGGGPLLDAGVQGIFVVKLDTNGNHVWSRGFALTSGYLVRPALAVDTAGNVLIAGGFRGTVSFGGGSLTSADNDNVYVVKLNASGNHVWSRHYGDSGDQIATAIAVDFAGNHVIAGHYNGALIIGGSIISSPGPQDIFVTKLDDSGARFWLRGFGNASAGTPTSVAVDLQGDVVIAGEFQGTLDFDSGLLISYPSFRDLFVAKLAGDAGIVHWSRMLGDEFDETSPHLAIDANNGILIAGSFQGSIDLGTGPMVGSASDYSGFVASWHPAGEPLWAQPILAGGNLFIHGVAVDVFHRITLTGRYEGPLHLPGSEPHVSVGSADIFVAALQPFGGYLWSRSIGDASFQMPNGIAMDGLGNAVVVGGFGGTIDFGNGPLTATNTDIFITKITP